MALRETLAVTRSIRPLILLCLAGCATAQADVYAINGSLGVTSDFVYRGLSLTRGEPTAQASLDVEFPHEFYIGGFIAGADPNPGPSPKVEFDVWAGRYWKLGEHYSADLRVTQYTYPDDPRRINYNRTELAGTAGWRNRLFLTAIYSPNTQALGSSPGYRNDGAWAAEVSGRHPFNDQWSASAGVGHYGLGGVYSSGFWYWNATVTAALDPIEIQLAYLGADHTADHHFVPESVGERVALTLLWRFSSSPD
jgi:uncharacterized protein (TIGR02001 family)